MKDFPAEKLSQLLKEIDQALASGAKPIAAFDADGTLWESDMGEDFFQHQIDNKLVPLPDDPWAHYHDLKFKKSPPDAYLWLAQINAGVPVEKVRGWATDCLEKISPVSIFPAQKKVIDHLHDHGVHVYVVTASIKWAIEPGAKLFGIPEERVIGVNTKLIDGVVTDEQGGVITYREGKAKALLEATGGVAPFFTAGNTGGDLHLLEAATHIPFVNTSAPEDDENYQTEQQMLALAKKRGWHHHSYL